MNEDELTKTWESIPEDVKILFLLLLGKEAGIYEDNNMEGSL